jgi:hypothetical protein
MSVEKASRGSVHGGLISTGVYRATAPVRHGTTKHPDERHSKKCGLTSADSGLQLDLGDCAKRCLSEDTAPCGLFSRAEDKLKRRIT